MIGDLRIGTDTVMEIVPRVRPPQDNMLKLTVHYGSRDQGLSLLMTSHQVQAFYNYLDMENVPPLVIDGVTMCLRVVQEPDGRTWVRIYRADDSRSKLTFLTDHETSALYEWLGMALSGEWDGWILS